MTRSRMKPILATLFLGAAAVARLAAQAAVPAAGTAAGTAAPVYVVSGAWKGSVFGDIGGADKIVPENFEIAERGDGSVALRSANDRGKIASTSEGIAYYYREVPADSDFELAVTASVGTFAKNNQVSLGIMLRDKVYSNEFVKTDLGSYIAVGPINAANPIAQFAFMRGPEGLVKTADIAKSAPPGPGTSYRMSLKKSGNVYVLSFGDEEPFTIAQAPAFTAPAFAGETLYIGLFTSRNAQATFTDLRFAVNEKSVSGLELDAAGVKTRYRVGEALDLAGLRVQAIYD
ncbi:MAG: hypothetical protein Q8M76_05890, partial [Spirochaetaceae bacterium]|nr:hypothetical protein [Spirochaetaceae bacterium]